MLVKPLLVSEEIAQRSSDLLTFVALGAAREQARVLEHLAPQLNKLRDCIEGVMLRESKLMTWCSPWDEAGARHSQSPVDAKTWP